MGPAKKSPFDSGAGQVHRAANRQEKEGTPERERSVCRRGSIPRQQTEEVPVQSNVCFDGGQPPRWSVQRVPISSYSGGSQTANKILASSPHTPEGIVVCTPATPGLRLLWNNSLPWLQFSRLLKPGRSNSMILGLCPLLSAELT